MMAISRTKLIVAMALAAVISDFATPAFAADLTAAGADAAGNKDGTIPAYNTSSSLESGWTSGKNRVDFWKYKGEKPLVVIDTSNVDKYADKLTPGQVALVKVNKGYTMPVYPSHRDCELPAYVQANTKAAAGKASIGSDGWSIKNAVLPSVPFPEPKSGIEAMWNFLTRYHGAGLIWQDGYTIVSASPGQSNRIDVRWKQIFYYPWAKEGQPTPLKDDGMLMGVWYGYSQPAALSGQAVINRVYFKDDTESYYYFTGQRRVRRLPSYAYDAPLIGFENQYTVDQSLNFFGLPDRFDWKLLGKKEIYVPYNSFGMLDTKTPITEGAQENFINPNNRRYELHRVWVVEGTVKSGMRHTMPKKLLYLDEDTWTAVVGDDYDTQGKVWKVKESPVTPISELHGACSADQFVMYDLNDGRYVGDGLVFGASKDPKYYEENDGNPAFKDDYYTMESLQQQSSR
jgi:hypothetical protein